MSALLWPRLLSLGQERRPILLFKNEVAAPACGKRIEDTFISLASNRAGLATFSNEQPFHLGACRARRPNWARRSLRCDLLLFAGSERQRWVLEYGSLLFLDKIRLVCFPATKPGANLCTMNSATRGIWRNARPARASRTLSSYRWSWSR